MGLLILKKGNYDLKVTNNLLWHNNYKTGNDFEYYIPIVSNDSCSIVYTLTDMFTENVCHAQTDGQKDILQK